MKNLINANQKTLKKFADAIVWHYENYVQYQSKPRIFIYENETYFDTNSPVFGMSEVIFNHEKDCKIIFDFYDLEELLAELEIDFEDIEKYRDEVIEAVINTIEKILEDFN